MPLVPSFLAPQKRKQNKAKPWLVVGRLIPLGAVSIHRVLTLQFSRYDQTTATERHQGPNGGHGGPKTMRPQRIGPENPTC